MGRHKRFEPRALARALADVGAVNVGAAGTFVVRGKIGPARLRAEILRRLPFDAETMICPAREIIALAHDDAFGPGPPEPDARRFVSVMTAPPRRVPPLPLGRPAGVRWEVEIVRVSGRYALGLWRRLGRRVLYPNDVVEQSLGVSATTRAWNTICAIRRILGTP